MPYRPEIDALACTGHAQCEAIAPDVFVLEDVAVVIGTGTDSDILRAAEACPSTAIRVLDDSGAQIYP
jgi:ferredoxin